MTVFQIKIFPEPILYPISKLIVSILSVSCSYFILKATTKIFNEVCFLSYLVEYKWIHLKADIRRIRAKFVQNKSTDLPQNGRGKQQSFWKFSKSEQKTLHFYLEHIDGTLRPKNYFDCIHKYKHQNVNVRIFLSL